MQKQSRNQERRAETQRGNGKTAPLTISTGKVHEYLGMEIDFSKKGKVTYSQYDYINEILFSVSKYKDMQGESPTPASPHLFQNDMKHQYSYPRTKQIYSIIMLRSSYFCAKEQDPISKQLLRFSALA